VPHCELMLTEDVDFPYIESKDGTQSGQVLMPLSIHVCYGDFGTMGLLGIGYLGTLSHDLK
jgi:hypothetical protein